MAIRRVLEIGSNQPGDRLKSVLSRPSPAKAAICRPSAVQKYLLHDKSRYLANIAQCKEKIKAGESYEVCLTNRVQVPLHSHDLKDVFETYLTLRETNPAPYSCFIKNEAFSILCSSPERFLKIDREGEVEARPIKGTMPRNKDPERDEPNRNRPERREAFLQREPHDCRPAP